MIFSYFSLFPYTFFRFFIPFICPICFHSLFAGLRLCIKSSFCPIYKKSWAGLAMITAGQCHSHRDNLPRCRGGKNKGISGPSNQPARQLQFGSFCARKFDSKPPYCVRVRAVCVGRVRNWECVLVGVVARGLERGRGSLSRRAFPSLPAEGRQSPLQLWRASSLSAARSPRRILRCAVAHRWTPLARQERRPPSAPRPAGYAPPSGSRYSSPFLFLPRGSAIAPLAGEGKSLVMAEAQPKVSA